MRKWNNKIRRLKGWLLDCKCLYIFRVCTFFVLLQHSFLLKKRNDRAVLIIWFHDCWLHYYSLSWTHFWNGKVAVTLMKESLQKSTRNGKVTIKLDRYVEVPTVENHTVQNSVSSFAETSRGINCIVYVHNVQRSFPQFQPP